MSKIAEFDYDCESLKFSMFTRALQNGLAVRFRALGTSMLPSLWPGDILTIQPAHQALVEAGDIVLAHCKDEIVVHRLVKIVGSANGPLVILRGDAMPQDDLPIRFSEVLGKVTRIERKDRLPILPSKLSFAIRISGFLLCRWQGLRNFALRLHSMREIAVAR